MDRELTLVPMVGGATDAAFAGRTGKAAVVESFGLAGAGYHARGEDACAGRLPTRGLRNSTCPAKRRWPPR